MIELLIVLGILALVSTMIVLIINPTQLVAQARDATRISDLRRIDTAIQLNKNSLDETLTDNTAANIVYVSLPDTNSILTDNCGTNGEYPLPTLTTGWQYRCVTSSANLRKIDGNGWIPIVFTSVTTNPLLSLPVDPINTAIGGYYIYTQSGLATALQSNKYISEIASTDGGNQDDYFETAPIVWIAGGGGGTARYWIGGTGTWNATDTTHWSASSGGAPGASVPTSLDNVFVDTNSGFGAGGTLSIPVNVSSRDFTSSVGAAYVIDMTSGWVDIWGSLKYESGITQVNNQTEFDFNATRPVTIDFGGNAGGIAYIYLFGYQGTYTLLSDVYLTKDLYSENGTLDLNGFNWTSVDFDFDAWVDVPNRQPIIYLRGGTVNVKFFDIHPESKTGLHPIIYAGTSLIKLSNTSGLPVSPYMSGADGTYYNLWIAETGTSNSNIFINGDNTYNNVRVAGGLTVTWDYGGTTYLDSLTLEGSPGNLVTFNADVNTFNRDLMDNYTIIGSELVSNGGFTGNANGWALGTGWVYNNNALDHGGSINGDATQTVAVQDGKMYLISIEGVAYTSGNYVAVIPGIGYSYYSGTGVKRMIETVTGGNTQLQVRAYNFTGTFVGTIDNVSVKEVKVNPHTFVKSSGTVSVSYVDLTHNHATGGAAFYASQSIDGGDNDGWIFDSGSAHWDKVNDVEADPGDGNATYVYTSSLTEQKDAYQLTNHTTETGTINLVTVHAWGKGDGCAKVYLRLVTSEYGGSSTSCGGDTAWNIHPQESTNNKPGTFDLWDWAAIDNLQVGVGIYKNGAVEMKITKVYVVVTYNTSQTLILYPNGVGDYTNISSQFPP